MSNIREVESVIQGLKYSKVNTQQLQAEKSGSHVWSLDVYCFFGVMLARCSTTTVSMVGTFNKTNPSTTAAYQELLDSVHKTLHASWKVNAAAGYERRWSITNGAWFCGRLDQPLAISAWPATRAAASDPLRNSIGRPDLEDTGFIRTRLHLTSAVVPQSARLHSTSRNAYTAMFSYLTLTRHVAIL